MPTPLVRLLPMSEQHYPIYCAYFIEDYAQDLASNHGHDLPTARHKAELTLRQSLPQGVATPGHSLLCIVPAQESGAREEPLGYLWHALQADRGETFICDFYMDPTHRGQGYGKAAMAVLEAELKAIGVDQIKLRVAQDNPRALALYQELGFVITGYNMAKHLD
ncbi:GNAT family N-acetyltransferase [Aeromonas eucrenophila]|uniref:GNAT family N-acetyltransferase n=1 Tax=Aeromonas eucrenophila TaxID=649 RepID=A0ABW0Y7D3_9GAMM|nr:GNAT family N-acetyltransferase [Aeromonas eucrenophila]